jgi:RNA polymerase sigma-70 factor (ECF subfamily)
MRKGEVMDKGSEAYQRFLDGDEQALEQIVMDYRDGLIIYLYSLVQDWHLAEELTEDTFVRLFTKKPKDRKKSTFKTWLYTIGRNLAISHYRKVKHQAVRPVEQELCDREGQSPEEELIREEEKRNLYRAIGNLKTSHRQVLYLVYLEGMDCREASRIMGKTHHGTQVLLSRAREALKNILKNEEDER